MVILSVAFGALGLLWFMALPAYLAGRIEEKIVARLPGSMVEATGVSLGLLSLDFHLTLRAKGMQLVGVGVGIEGSPWEIASDWRAADALTVGPGRVDLEMEGLSALQGKLLGPGGRAPAAATRVEAPRPLPALRLAGLDVRVRGWELGELELLGATGELDRAESAELRARAASLRDATRSLEFANPRLVLARDALGWRPRRMETEHADIVLGEGPRRGWSALLASFRPDTGRMEVIEASSRGVAPAGVDGAEASEGLASYTALFEGPLEAALGTLTVRATDGESPLLDGLHATLEVSEGRMASHARGSLSGGSLAWDVAFEPARRHAEGRLHVDGLPLTLVEPLLPEVPLHRPEAARFAADVRLDRTADGVLTLEGELGLRGMALDDPAIGPVPVRDLDLAWEGKATFDTERRRLEVADSNLTVRGVATRWRAELELGEDAWSARVRATLPPTRCNDAVGAIPEDLLQDAAGFRWTGNIGGQLRFAARSDDLEGTRLEVDVANGCLFESVPAFADLRRLQGPFVHRVREPDGHLFEMSAGPGTANWAPLHVTSPFLVHAVLGHEDAAFLRHRGFSVGSIRDALVRNLETGAYRRGGSTITMQLAKNVFLHREKTLARKAQEVLLTWWLETALPKEELLALYLNLIEYGPGVYGIRSAAEHYFGRHPSELTAAESAYLACILPDPKGFHAQWQAGRPPERMRRRVGRFLRVLHERGRIDDAALADGLAQLEELRFHRTGRAASDWPQAGRARALPFATAVLGDPFEAFLAPEGGEPATREPVPLEQL